MIRARQHSLSSIWDNLTLYGNLLILGVTPLFLNDERAVVLDDRTEASVANEQVGLDVLRIGCRIATRSLQRQPRLRRLTLTIA